jgi:hypothetical protein
VNDHQLALDAERRLLGAMMLGGSEEASRLLTPDDFYERRHALVFDHLRELWASGEPTDPVAVLKRLADRGELSRPETGLYLHAIYEQAADPIQIPHYARIVLEETERRRYAVLAVKLARAAEVDDPATRRTLAAEILSEATSAGGPRERDSWAPVDLGPYLDGTYERPEPTVGLARKDGLRLLYPGKEHAVIGEMEAGKSWFSLACVATELNAGNCVVYIHFEEDDPADSVDRLCALGVPTHRIREGFLFIGPRKPVTPDGINRLLTYAPTLVVLDGQNEGMVLHAQAIREEDGAGKFRALLVKPWTEAGAAVLTCDHVVKDKEARGRYALGSIHKGNALSGSLIVLENAEPFGRGERGSSRVYVTKDRPGHLRRHGQPTKTSGKTFMGQLVVDDTRRWRDALDLVLLPPNDDKPAADKPESLLGEQVLGVVAAAPGEIVGSSRILYALLRKAGVNARNTAVNDAVDDLLAAGRLAEFPGSRGARGFRLVTASPTASQDQKEVLV